MDTLTSTSAARGGLHEAIAKARWRGERTLLTVRGEPVAALVPLVDLQQLEQRTTQVQEPPR